MVAPLSGLRVLDLSTGISGPYCTKLLADYGARVIKVEPPGQGDPARREGPFSLDIPHPEKSGLFLFLNTNKESITLNLDNRSGQRLFRRMCEDIDVVVESFEPTRADSLGLGYECLSGINPTLVVTSVTDFGNDSPLRDTKVTDLLAFARTGFMYPMGEPDKPPVRPGGPCAQFITGLCACFGTLMAYFSALCSGQGQQVEISLLDAVLSFLIFDSTAYSYSGEVRRRVGNWTGTHLGMTESLQQTKDGHIVFAVGPGYERWRLLWEVLLEMPWVLEDERYRSVEDQISHSAELEAIVQPWLRDHTSAEVFHKGQDLRLLFGQILTMQELFESGHLRERDYFARVEHPAMGPVNLPGLPLRFSKTPGDGLSPSPALGQHNVQVYSDLLGLERSDLVRLRHIGVI